MENEWRQDWEKHKNGPGRWKVLRSIYSYLTPMIENGERFDPYFIDWCGTFTPIEDALWHDIRYMDLPFYPQYPIGNCFVDFADPQRKIAIECDGKQWHDAEKDKKRDAKLGELGWTVIRFTGSQCFMRDDNPNGPYGELNRLYEMYRFLELDEEAA